MTMDEKTGMNNLFLATESLAPGNGGVARVARLMARVIGEEAEQNGLGARCLSFSDQQFEGEDFLDGGTARGSRWRYVLQVQLAALGCTHFIYDFLGMSRAHGRLPCFRRPYMSWIHGVEVWEDARPDRLECARRADMLLCNSYFTREIADELHGGFSDARVCWLGTETDERPSENISDGQVPTVLIVGRMQAGRDKGHRALIDAWPEVVSAVPHAVLRIVGTGSDEDALRRRAEDSPVSGRIVFEGFVSEAKLDQMYQEASVFAMPSRGEGFGLVYIEAMRHGLPVVASIHDAAPEIVIDGQTGYAVDLGREDELSGALIGLLQNPERAHEMGRAGQRRWEENFTYSAFRSRFRRHLHDFLEI